MSMPRETLESYLKDSFPDATLTFTDLAGDNNHWQVTIESAQFLGKSRIAQHQMVYKALRGKVGDGSDALHALSIKTCLPQ